MSNVVFASDWHLYHGNIVKHSRRFEFMDSFERDEFHRLESIGDKRKRSLRISRRTLDRMHNAIIEGLNAVAGPNDIIWCLGDVYFGRDLNELWAIRKRIHCKTINLSFGNHDKFLRRLHAPYYRIGSSTKTPKQFEELLNIINGLCDQRIDSLEALARVHRIELTNPLYGIFNEIYEQTQIRVNDQDIFLNHYAKAVWNKSHYGTWSLYGHSHGSFEKWREDHMPRAKTIDVGIDNRARMGLGYTPWTFDELKEWMALRNGQSVDHHDSDQINED